MALVAMRARFLPPTEINAGLNGAIGARHGTDRCD
jgi:hypothetical protein